MNNTDNIGISEIGMEEEFATFKKIEAKKKQKEYYQKYRAKKMGNKEVKNGKKISNLDENGKKISRKEYKHLWYLANKKKCDERNRKWAKNNPDKVQMQNRRYFEKNKHKFKEYYKQHREEIIIRNKEYQKIYREKMKLKNMEKTKKYTEKNKDMIQRLRIEKKLIVKERGNI